MHISAWQFSLDVLMLISASFGFQMKIQWFKWALSVPPLGQVQSPGLLFRIFFRSFFQSKSRRFENAICCRIFGVFQRFLVKKHRFVDDFGSIFGRFSMFFSWSFPDQNFNGFWHFLEEKAGNRKTRISWKPLFYLPRKNNGFQGAPG